MRKILLVAAAIVIVGIATVVLLYATYQRKYLLAEASQAEIIGLHQSLQGAHALSDLGTNGVVVALDRAFFYKIAAALSGQSITLHSKDLGDIRITVQALVIRPQAGRMSAHLELLIESPARNISLSLAVDGFAYFAGITRQGSTTSEDPVDIANFKLFPISIEPELTFGFLDIRGRRFVSDTISHGVIATFVDQLAVRAPFRPHFKFSYATPTKITQHFGDNGSGTIVLVATPTPPFQVDEWVSVTAPIFESQGVILAAALTANDQPPTPTAAPSPGPVTQEGLQKTRAAVEAAESGPANFFAKDVAITVGSTAFQNLLQQLSVALANFKISVQGESISGRLFDKRWSDKVLGDGGFYAEIRDAKAINATISFGKPGIAVDPTHGPRITLPLSAAFSAPLHVQVDPLIGGGVGTEAKIEGSAQITVNGWFGTATLPFEGATIAIGGPVLACTVLEISAHTDGKLKIGSGWTNVPAIGAKFGQVVGKDPNEPGIIAGPEVDIALVPPMSSGELTSVNGLFAHISLNSFAAGAQTGGYRLATSFGITVSNRQPDPPSKDYLDRLHAAVAARWAAATQQSCPDAPAVRIEVGDLEFGPNGELIKFIVNAWNDITKGPGKNNEVVKLLGRIQDAAGSFDDASKQLASQVTQLAQKAFPADPGIQHAANEASKSVTKVFTNPGKAASDFGKQVMKGFR